MEVRYFTYACVSSNLAFNIVRSILLFGHRYILDFVSVILAIISSRKIKVEVVNDGKYVLAIVFLHFINITTFNVVALVFRTYPNVFAVAGNLSVLEPPTDILLLTFVPKVGITTFVLLVNYSLIQFFFPINRLRQHCLVK